MRGWLRRASRISISWLPNLVSELVFLLVDLGLDIERVEIMSAFARLADIVDGASHVSDSWYPIMVYSSDFVEMFDKKA